MYNKICSPGWITFLSKRQVDVFSKEAGIDTNLRLHIHCLRKSWATNLANSGRVPVHTLMSLGGWADIRTCEKYYLKISDANKERACEVLNELALPCPP